MGSLLPRAPWAGPLSLLWLSSGCDLMGTLGEAVSGPHWRGSLGLRPLFGQLFSSFCPVFWLTPSRALLLLLVASWDITWALCALPWPPQDCCSQSTGGKAKARTPEATCLWGLSICPQWAVSPAHPSPRPVPVVCQLSGHRWTEPPVSLGTGEARWRNGAGLGGGTPRWAEASPGEAPDIWDSGCRCC